MYVRCAQLAWLRDAARTRPIVRKVQQGGATVWRLLAELWLVSFHKMQTKLTWTLELNRLGELGIQIRQLTGLESNARLA